MKMNKNHKLIMSTATYPRGLRFIECQECKYALAVEVDERGFLQMHTRIKVNAGELDATHTYSHAH
jgi:hypothetical protein